jgi:hypothetical protein
MKILSQIRFYLVLVSLSLITLLILYLNQKEELIECQTEKGYIPGGDIERAQLMEQVDSLRNEMFVKEIQLGSYEVMWGILEEVNKPLADSINLQVE